MRSVLGTAASLVAFVFLVTVTSAAARADDNAPTAGPPIADGEAGILLLDDGGVLTGQITRAADWYMVTRGGGQMQIAKKRVMLVCRTLAEAYEFRRKQMNGEKVADHLRLAEWCIRYELRAEADHELAEARRLDPDQPRLAVLERRLEKMSGSPTVKGSVYLGAVKAGAKPQAAGVALPAAANTAELPSGVVELFTRKVQPVLVNNCTTSGCHQLGGKQSFQLDRALLRGEANRRSTMHNLEATLALVDHAHPDQSPLLTVPRKTHGGTAGPIFGPRQEQAFKHLVDWVALVVPPPEAPPAPVATKANGVDANAATGNASALPEDADSAGTPTQDAAHLPSHRRPAVRDAAATDEEVPMTLRRPHRLQYGAQPKSWQPRDAFDPEIFNRGQRARAQLGSGLKTVAGVCDPGGFLARPASQRPATATVQASSAADATTAEKR
jgi:hypothetical protein